MVARYPLRSASHSEVEWRHAKPDGGRRKLKRRVGSAWLDETAGGVWVKRPGRPQAGHLDARAAHVEAEALVCAVELELRDVERRDGRTAPTFREVTEAWLEWLETVKGVKPSTLRDHRYVLAEPGSPHKHGGGTSAGLVMGALGDLPAATVTT